MPAPADTVPSSQSGIETLSTGERHIPASRRADGTVRKEIKVRPGYRPPEDVEVYKNRTAQAWNNRGKGGVPGADFVNSKGTTQKNAHGSETTKTKPRKPATKDTIPEPAQTAPEPTEPENHEADKDKEARKLSKKLRQARELQQKKENGDVLLPEQFEKVIRINELIRQLENLGFTADGQPKS